MPGARELVKRRVPEPVLDRLRYLRHLVGAIVAGGEVAHLRAEFAELIDARTRDLLARSDEVLSSYDRRVAAVATRLLDLEDRVAAGGLEEPDADRVLAAHVGVLPLHLDHRLAADLALAGRGSPEEERRRLRSYASLLGAHQPVLELGCGRGDLLATLAESGIHAAGVDDNPILVTEACRAGVDAVREDLLVHLARHAEGSVSSVAALDVLQRMGAGDLTRLVRSAAKVLAPGGVLLVETPDPSSDDGRAALWRDPLCVRLYASDTLKLFCRDAGLEVASVEAAPVVESSGVGRYALVARRP